MVERFRPFGVVHLATLAMVAAVALVAALAVRRGRAVARVVSASVAVMLPLSLVSLMWLDAGEGVSWRSYAPLQLCDVAVPIAVFALLRRDALAFELTLSWTVAGTLPALLTPDVAESFPHGRYLLYFAQHGGLVVAMVVLIAIGMRPRPGTPFRALAWLNALALVVGTIDALTGANFMYLRAKPSAATPLDHLGPWPVYVLACEPIALGVFAATCAILSPRRHARGADDDGDAGATSASRSREA